MNRRSLAIIVSLCLSASIAHSEAPLDPILNSIVRIYLNRAVEMSDQTNLFVENGRDRIVVAAHVYKYGSLRIEIRRIDKSIVVVDDGTETTIWKSAYPEERGIRELLDEFNAGL